MLSEDLRARIAALNRTAWQRRPVDLPVRRDDLELLVTGKEAEGSAGSFYLVRRSLSEFGSAPLDCLIREHQQLAGDWSALHPELASFARSFPDRALFLDLETCGFSGTPLFLIGLLRQADGELVVEQLLARDYAEEPAVLAQLWSLIPTYDVLVTFNGKAFDWPLLVDRSTVHRIVTEEGRGQRAKSGAPEHCDLLPFARRHWKKPLGLPNCKLQTLEATVCRRYRSGDIPSYQIAPAYHAFVRSGDARALRQILHHNALDLLTLAQLSLILVQQLTGERLISW